MLLERRMEILAKSPIFQGISSGALTHLAKHCIERKIDRGQILFTADDPSEGLYIVLSGSMRAFRVSRSGREQTIHVEHAGGTLADVPALDGGPYPSTAIAEEDSELLFLGKEKLRSLMLQYPEMALAALSYIARKLRKIAAKVEQLALMDVGQRLASLLLDEAHEITPHPKDGVSFFLPSSHSQIAAQLGTVREIVTRGLNKLARQNIIEIRGHHVTVLDMSALLERAENPHK
jgi:CRP/FNR family transcriptional regulator